MGCVKSGGEQTLGVVPQKDVTHHTDAFPERYQHLGAGRDHCIWRLLSPGASPFPPLHLLPGKVEREQQLLR